MHIVHPAGSLIGWIHSNSHVWDSVVNVDFFFSVLLLICMQALYQSMCQSLVNLHSIKLDDGTASLEFVSKQGIPAAAAAAAASAVVSSLAAAAIELHCCLCCWCYYCRLLQ